MLSGDRGRSFENLLNQLCAATLLAPPSNSDREQMPRRPSIDLRWGGGHVRGCVRLTHSSLWVDPNLRLDSGIGDQTCSDATGTTTEGGSVTGP